MSAAPRFKVQYDLGLTEAERLKAYGLRKAIRIAVNRSTGPLKGAEQAAAQLIAKTGATAKSIRIKVKVYRQFFTVAVVGPAGGFVRKGARVKRGRRSKVPFRRNLRKDIRPARYAHILERGSKRSRPRPFITPAEPVLFQVRDRIAAEVAREIERQLANSSAG